MEPRVSLVTLGVADIRRAREFYQRLGWAGQEVEGTVFMQAGCMALVLWDRGRLAADCNIADAGRGGFDGVVLAHNVRSTREVDEVMANAQAAGAVVTKAAARTFYGGYAGYFTDPDGHAWEIARNPGFPLSADGALTIPDLGR